MKARIVDRLRITTYNENGSVKEYRETYDHSNIDHRIMAEHGDIECFAADIVLDAGLAETARMVAARFPYVSIGTGTTTPEHDDVELESEILDRAVAATSLTTTFYTDDTSNWVGSFTPTYDVDISESGIHLLSAPATGDITYSRETFTPISCVADRLFSVAWAVIQMR